MLTATTVRCFLFRDKIGTHKAMILKYLDRLGWNRHKAFIYSRTRSFSNLGAALNAILSVVFVLRFKRNVGMLFIVSTIPMALDFLLVASYPSYMNDVSIEVSKKKRSVTEIGYDTWIALRTLMTTSRSRRAVLSAATFLGLYTTLKHFIQPIVKVHGASILEAWGVPGTHVDDGKKILLGCVYAIFYVVSAVGTRNSWRLKSIFRSPKHAMDVLFDVYLILLLVVAMLLRHHLAIAVIPCYLLMFLLQNLWKPWGVAGVSGLLGKERRALALSSESLLKTLLQSVLAPIIGYVADRYSLDEMFAVTGFGFLIVNHLLCFGAWESGSDASVLSSSSSSSSSNGKKNSDLLREEEGRSLLPNSSNGSASK